MILIDFEYSGYNPRAFDLAVYFAETIFDNLHPLGNGIKSHLENFINEDE
jgi:thiamine kinase-like enzyme